MYVETLRKYSGLVRRDPIFSYYLILLERAQSLILLSMFYKNNLKKLSFKEVVIKIL